MTEPKSPGGRAALPPIRFAELADALLSNADSLVAQWLPGGAQRGHEYVCGSLRGGPGTSTSVNLTTGRWADFSAAEEKGGDLLSLYAAIHGLTMAKAALEVAREEGLEDVAGIVKQASPGAAPEPRPPATAPPPPSPSKPREVEGWRAIRPVPTHAPAATFHHPHRKPEDIVHVAEYRAGDDLAGYVVRFRTSDGGKDTLPYTWCTSPRDGASRWHWKTWDEPRPLYFPGRSLPSARTVVLVEGEKKADALQLLLDQGAPGVYCVASWPGGCKAWKKADWAVLAGCTVIAWPDCDAKREPLTRAEREASPDPAAQQVLAQGKPMLPESKQPGMAAMLGIGGHLHQAHQCVVQLLPIPQPGAVADGWDCGDAIEHDGWDFDRVLSFLASANAMPIEGAAPEPAAAGGGGGKKIDGPADAEGEESGKPKPWWIRPYWDADKSRWLVSRKLVIQALTHDDQLSGTLGLNLLSNNIEARQEWPWLHGKAGPITSAVDLRLGRYLSDTYGLPSINRAALMEAIETVAHENPFHPVRDYLAALRHDGVPRIGKWLVHAIGERPDTLTRPMYEYIGLAGFYWLMGMVNRVMEPGCKFDYCPVLEGPGGLGKSTLVEALAGSAWFSDTHFDVGRGKEGQEQVQGLWLYEIAELANFGKAEIALIKAFISAKVDRYRPSYGRVVESYARQCVLTGTTNENTYLRDRSGNRRFWPIPVRWRINIPWVKKWRDQLFAEAYAMYLQGVDFTPSPEEELRLFVPVQESRLVETAVISELLNVLTRPPTASGIGAVVNELTEFVTIAQLTLALGVDAAKSNAALEAQIRGWMEHEGWTRVKKQINGTRGWGYLRPNIWPPVEKEEPGDSTPQAGMQGSDQRKDADDEPF